ncbi:MAG TPA: hypothetical protein ENH82_07965 [bacterium]|nr:hypothetical protein [bacterium]
MFKVFSGKGFQITFENGYTISTMFDTLNYCKNKELGETSYDKTYKHAELTECINAEIAIWENDKDGNRYLWVTKQAYESIEGEEAHDDVEGWVTTDKWLRYINWTADRTAGVNK